MVAGGERWREGIVREYGMDMYTLLYLKWITNKDLLHSTRTLLGVMCQPGWERGLGGHHPSESCKRESFLASVSLGCCRKTLIFLGL